MKFFNHTEEKIILIVNNKSVELEPNKEWETECEFGTKVTIKHTYDSLAMSKKKIAKDNMNESLVDVLIASYKPPYFNVVLDCSYFLKCQSDTEIYIRKEQIRPIYYCSYDRLYPHVSGGTVIEVAHTFKEKENFKKHYKDATSKSSKKTFMILEGILTMCMIPFIITAFRAQVVIGIVSLLLGLGCLTAVWMFYALVNKLTSGVDNTIVFSEFESDKIINYFAQEKRVH